MRQMFPSCKTFSVKKLLLFLTDSSRQNTGSEGSPLPGFLTNVGGWLLVTAVFCAPWAFGSRPYWAALTLAGGLLLAVALWLVACLAETRLPKVPPVCGCLVLALTAFAGISLLNPRSTFDVERGSFLPNPMYLPFLPTTVDVSNGWSFTVEMLAYLLVIPMAADLSSRPAWRRRWLGTMAVSGFLVAVAGLILKWGFLPQLTEYLAQRPWAQGKIFGPFDYHGNAGAFLNLVLPVAASRAAVSHGLRRKGWQGAVVTLYVALLVNPSRAALVIGMVLSPLTLWLMLRGDPSFRSLGSNHRGRWASGAGLVGALLVVAVLLQTHQDSRPVRRFFHLSSELREPEYPRYLQSRAAWEMTQERPLFGAGIGSYKLLVQSSSIRRYYFAPAFRPGEPFTVLSHTHEDYLQTLAEWGWIGFCGWSALVCGAFVMLGKLLRGTRFGSRTALALGVALLGVYLHAIGDCPVQIPAIQFYVALCLGMSWGSGGWQSDSQTAVNV